VVRRKRKKITTFNNIEERNEENTIGREKRNCVR
jgi:hypothetical protein